MNDQLQQDVGLYLDEDRAVVIGKETERPYSGKYNFIDGYGQYVCKQCKSALFHSDTKFESGCGWPSFDDAIAGAVHRHPDPDGKRVEVVCGHCAGHLGHVFDGEGFTETDQRYCINSISLEFVSQEAISESEYVQQATFAAGCFWGPEYVFQETEGVLHTRAGYTGGSWDKPTYEVVCSDNTGHAEVVEVTFDSRKVTYADLLHRFFSIHDPSQLNQQGPDVGSQYRSAIFYHTDQQRQVAEAAILALREDGQEVVTEVQEQPHFWVAEEVHQSYYKKKGVEPNCMIDLDRY